MNPNTNKSVKSVQNGSNPEFDLFSTISTMKKKKIYYENVNLKIFFF